MRDTEEIAREIVGDQIIDQDELLARLKGKPYTSRQKTYPVYAPDPPATWRRKFTWLLVAAVLTAPPVAIFLHQRDLDQRFPCQRTEKAVMRKYPELAALARTQDAERDALHDAQSGQTNCKTYRIYPDDNPGDEPAAYPTSHDVELCDEDLVENINASRKQYWSLFDEHRKAWLDACVRLTSTTIKPD